MNGTALDQQIEIINELKELELTEPQSFCIMAQRNVDCMTYDGRNYYHPRKIDLLREKIKEGKFDEEAIEIAKIMYNDMIDRFSMKLSDQTNTYKKTVRREINRFRRRMRAIKFTQQLLQIIVIIGATSVPFILNVPNSPREIPTYVSAAVAISATLLNFYKFGEHIEHSYQAAEKMQLEYNLFQTQRGDYKALSPGCALDLFMDKIDELRQEQYQFSLSIEKAAQEQNKEQIQAINKSKNEK